MVKLITLKTNHTIICDLTENLNDYSLHNPVQIYSQPSQEGPVVGFAPFLEYCEEFQSGIRINKEDVLCVTTPVTEILNQYNKIFGSGIEVVSSMPNTLSRVK